MHNFDNNFINARDFVQCVSDGCEVEFIYGGLTYSVTPSNSKIVVCEADNEDSIIEFANPVDSLNYPIGKKRLGDIFNDMKIIFRTF